MKYFISNLVYDIDEFDKIINIVNNFQNGEVGVELFAHTHDKEYQRKVDLLAQPLKDIPVTFHGPYIGIEATSAKGTKEYDWLIDSYKYAFELANKLSARHVVMHVSEQYIHPHEKLDKQKYSRENIPVILELSRQAGVSLAIENLGVPSRGTPLYDYNEYINLFKEYSTAKCLIDVGHSHVAGWDIKELISTLSDKICGYHLHNNDGREDLHNRIRNGNFDVKTFMSLVNQYTPNADLVLEYDPRNNMTEQDFIEDINYIKNI